MTKVRTLAALCGPELRSGPVTREPLPSDGGASHGGPFIVMSHAALFGPVPATDCDACGKPLSVDASNPGIEVCGSGVYLSIRGGDVRLETAPLCPSCASAIGMAALARWEIEEEEG